MAEDLATEQIKFISSFSEDAVRMAIKHHVIEKDQFRTFSVVLEQIHSGLEKLKKKSKKKTNTPQRSDKALFEERVLPQIVEKLAVYERQEYIEWNVKFDFLDEYKDLKLAELKERHAMIIQEEHSLTSLDLVVKLYRGLVYYRARVLYEGTNVKSMFLLEFGISYDTAMRYITFAALIKRYPRLMVCSLSYAQITKHQKRLLEHLAVNVELHDKLSQTLSASVNNKSIEIIPSDIEVPATVYNTDPDHVFETHTNDVVDTSEDREWLDESGDILNGSAQDEDVELTQELKGMCCPLN